SVPACCASTDARVHSPTGAPARLRCGRRCAALGGLRWHGQRGCPPFPPKFIHPSSRGFGMKKLIAALALCAGTVAFAANTAQTDKVQKAQQEQSAKKRDATQVFTQQQGDSSEEAERDAEEGVDATQVGRAIGKAAKDVTGIQSEREGTVKTAQAFN